MEHCHVRDCATGASVSIRACECGRLTAQQVFVHCEERGCLLDQARRRYGQHAVGPGTQLTVVTCSWMGLFVGMHESLRDQDEILREAKAGAALVCCMGSYSQPATGECRSSCAARTA